MNECGSPPCRFARSTARLAEPPRPPPRPTPTGLSTRTSSPAFNAAIASRACLVGSLQMIARVYPFGVEQLAEFVDPLDVCGLCHRDPVLTNPIGDPRIRRRPPTRLTRGSETQQVRIGSRHA